MQQSFDTNTENVHIEKMIQSLDVGGLPDNSEIEWLKEHFVIKKTAKKEQLLAKGQVCRCLYFVVKGCLHTYYTTDKGEEFTRCIALEKSFCWSIPSFLKQTPATENIESLTESELLVIDHASFLKLCQKSLWFRNSYATVLENLCIMYTERVQNLLTLNATERYKNLLQQNPRIIRQLPNKTVASYLGITQESLSRIKAAQ
ncbi:MAG: Crp/Fnr family transcriptional regulator [Bacteroidota bacterium]|nr:Crp/Fnr family transcriptional regulator [Bacteroidota bacterium]